MEKSKSVFRILLAHDLQKKMAPDTDRFLSGMDVVKAVINYIDKEVLVFIHSVNTSRAPVMAARKSGLPGYPHPHGQAQRAGSSRLGGGRPGNLGGFS